MKPGVSYKTFLHLNIIIIIFIFMSSSIVVYANSTHDTTCKFDNKTLLNKYESYTDACSGLRINVTENSIVVEAPKDSCIILNDIIINNFSTKMGYPICVSSLKIGSGGVPLYGLRSGDVVELNITIVYGASRSCTRLYGVSIGSDSSSSETEEGTSNNRRSAAASRAGGEGSGMHSAGLNSLTKGRPFRGSSPDVVTATLPYAVADGVVVASIALAGVLVGCGVLRRRSPP